MHAIRHPLSGAVYDLEADGTITVSLDGQQGSFTTDGVYLSGMVREADPHLCVWIGPTPPSPPPYERVWIYDVYVGLPDAPPCLRDYHDQGG